MRQFTGKNWGLGYRRKDSHKTPRQRIRDAMCPPDKKTLERRLLEKKAMNDALEKIEDRYDT